MAIHCSSFFALFFSCLLFYSFSARKRERVAVPNNKTITICVYWSLNKEKENESRASESEQEPFKLCVCVCVIMKVCINRRRRSSSRMVQKESEREILLIECIHSIACSFDQTWIKWQWYSSLIDRINRGFLPIRFEQDAFSYTLLILSHPSITEAVLFVWWILNKLLLLFSLAWKSHCLSFGHWTCIDTLFFFFYRSQTIDSQVQIVLEWER